MAQGCFRCGFHSPLIGSSMSRNISASKMYLGSAFSLILLVLLSCICSTSSVEPKEYLNYGKQTLEKEYRWVVKRIESGDWGKDADKLAETLPAVAILTRDASINGIEPNYPYKYKIGTYSSDRMYFLDALVLNLESFSRNLPNVAKCHNGQAKVFVGLINRAFGSLKKFQKALDRPASKSILLEYMNKYGRKHLEECLEESLGDFKKNQQSLSCRDAEHRLDTLVAMGEKYSSEETLLVRAETLDLAKGKYDAKKMLSAVRHLIGEADQQEQDARGPGKLLAWFIQQTCRDLRRAAPQMDLYNLALFMMPEKVSALEVPLKYRKLNEYSRICIPFESVSTYQAAESNVVRNTKY